MSEVIKLAIQHRDAPIPKLAAMAQEFADACADGRIRGACFIGIDSKGHPIRYTFCKENTLALLAAVSIEQHYLAGYQLSLAEDCDLGAEAEPED